MLDNSTTQSGLTMISEYVFPISQGGILLDPLGGACQPEVKHPSKKLPLPIG